RGHLHRPAKTVLRRGGLSIRFFNVLGGIISRYPFLPKLLPPYTVVTLLSVCGVSARQSYLDIVMVAIVGALLALVAVITLGVLVGSF
ncbi:hypothetical protein D2T29_14550, partial [Sinirhodobacter populi]